MTTTGEELEDPRTTRARARLGMVLQDKWRLDSLIGVGGMAAVYAATHRNGKRVAVKMLHAELNYEEEVRKRFLQEGYAANAIQHDGAVSVLDDDIASDGSAFIVMELLDGETVDQRWERNGQRLSIGEVLSIAEQLLEVLAAAHAKSVVHRDIKPENLFLTKAGVLKVLDFGIAKVFEQQQARQTSTRAGTLMGTPAFMAPEQALAHWDEVDGRTDLWAVGATMFTLLAGRYVHDASSSQEQVILSATRPARSLARVLAKAPPSLVAVVDRALAFDQSSRWPDALAMLQAVRAVRVELSGSETLTPLGPAASSVVTRTHSSLGAIPHAAGATAIDTGGLTSSTSAWMREREARLAETARLRASIGEWQERLAGAGKRVVEGQAKVAAGREERASLEQWFKRQVGTRTAAVENARKEVRRQMVFVARHAIADKATFGVDLDPAREQIAKLERASASAARDVTVHEAALEAYDVRSLRIGVMLIGVAMVLALVLILAPVVWRATRVIEAPPPAMGR
jgi:serine/threonine protein kinase